MMTVLIVDDEPLVRSSIRFALQEVSIKTSIIGEAEDGEDALELYRRWLPDVIITDVKMPVMNGLELIGEIRRTDLDTQFIIISGYAEFDYAQQAMKSGVVQYVLKPIKSRELEDALKQCIVRLDDKYSDLLAEDDQLIQYIKEHFSSPLTLDVLAEKFSFSPKYISSLVKNKVGQSFTEFLLTQRIKEAVELLTKTSLDVKTIAMSVGYEDQQYFHRVFKRKTGKTPLQYRREI